VAQRRNGNYEFRACPKNRQLLDGRWKKTGRSSYRLNHFALSWDPTGTTLTGPANIREEIVLDNRENSYSGTFTIDQYDTEGHLVVHISGVVSGQRITADWLVSVEEPQDGCRFLYTCNRPAEL
jgi:hypothetical protein